MVFLKQMGQRSPTSPNMTVGSLDGPTSKTDDLIIGEEFIGQTSGAQETVYVGKRSDNSIDFIYENQTRFFENEIVSFQSSGINGIAVILVMAAKILHLTSILMEDLLKVTMIIQEL